MASSGQAELLGDPEQVVTVATLDVDAVVHELAEEVLRAEDVAVVRRRLAGIGVAALLEQPVDLAGRAPGRGDQPAAVLLEQLAVHPGLVVVALERGQRRELEEVVHALGGRREHGDVGVHLARVVRGDLDRRRAGPVAADHGPSPLEAGARGDVALHAENRLDPGGLGPLVEVVRPEDVAVVGHRERRHAHPGGLGHEVGQSRGSVEHGVLGVHVEMHESVGA